MNNFEHLSIEELVVVHKGIVQVPLGTPGLKKAFDDVTEVAVAFVIPAGGVTVETTRNTYVFASVYLGVTDNVADVLPANVVLNLENTAVLLVF